MPDRTGELEQNVGSVAVRFLVNHLPTPDIHAAAVTELLQRHGDARLLLRSVRGYLRMVVRLLVQWRARSAWRPPRRGYDIGSAYVSSLAPRGSTSTCSRPYAVCTSRRSSPTSDA